MKYAVVSTGGHQYKVSEGDVVVVDRVEATDVYEFPKVLLVVDGDKRTIGQPIVSGVKVTAKVLEHGKGEKVRVAKFKAKARYRKVQGFRHSLTKMQIEKIG